MTNKLFIGRYSKSKGISLCNYKEGSIEEIETLQFIEDSSYLHKNGNILYSVIETAEYNGKNGGAVAAFNLSDKNRIINIQNTYGQHPCHLITDSKRTILFAANYSEGTVSVFPLNTDGSICKMCFELKHEGSGLHTQRQEKPHMHYLQFIEDEAYICVSDLGTDRISAYEIIKDNESIKLEHKFDINLPSGSGPRHFVCSIDGLYIYIINELNNTICTYKKTNKFSYTHVQTISTLPEGNYNSSAAAIKMTKDGRFIYASNRTHNSITVYEIIPESGLLKMIQNIECNGKIPRDILLDESEEYLLCANQESNSVISFLRDKERGELQLTDKVFITERPVCILQTNPLNI